MSYVVGKVFVLLFSVALKGRYKMIMGNALILVVSVFLLVIIFHMFLIFLVR